MPRLEARSARLQFAPEFGRAVQVAEFDRPGSSDEVETAQTIALMDELAARDAGRQSVIDAGERALTEAGLTLESPARAKAEAIFWWLKRNIRYVRTPGTSPLVDQTLIPPASLLAMRDPEGDCPQFSMLAAAMFRYSCIPSFYKTIAADESMPDTYSHVYNVVQIGPNAFLPFDASQAPVPGSEYAKPTKRRIWPLVTPDRCSKETMMLRPLRMTSGVRNASLRGAMGDASDFTQFLADNPDLASQYDQAISSNPSDYNPGVYDSPAAGGSAFNWSQLLNTVVNDAASIAAPLLRSSVGPKPYYVTSPSGQSVLYDPSTGRVSTPQSIGSAVNPNLMLIGLGLLAVLALNKK